MLGWEGRIWDNKSIMMIKAALPFLDIPVGETVDMEGLLRAVRCFCREQEQRLIDMLLNWLMMKRIFSMMSMMNEMNTASESSGGGMEHMLDLLKSQMPKEQQEMFEMMSMMMNAAGGFEEEAGEEDCSEESPEESVPEIWQSIVEKSKREGFDGNPE